MFYTAHVWAGRLHDALEIVPSSIDAERNLQSLTDAIHQVWAWSNLDGKRGMAVRQAATYGNLFIKVAERHAPTVAGRRVFLQFLDPSLVSDLAHDERGFLSYVRLDSPIALDVEERERTLAAGMQNGRSPVPATPEQQWVTEVWDKRNNRFRQWRHDKGPDEPIEKLGTPAFEHAITAFGFDFIPLVHVQFRDVGDIWGAGSYAHILDKIDEANRMATRLHQILYRYNKPLWALETDQSGSTGGDDRPARQHARLIGRGGTSSSTASIGGEDWLSLPGGTKAKPLVPDLDYQSHILAIDKHMGEIEDDAPELTWHRLRDMGVDLSGVAIQRMLGGAIARAEEARGALNTGLIRATQMGLTIGQLAGVIPSALGRFEQGAFEHEYDDGDVIPESESERWETVNLQLDAYVKLRELGWSQRAIMRDYGLTEQEIEAMEAERDDDDALAAEQRESAMLGAMQQFEAGQAPALAAGGD